MHLMRFQIKCKQSENACLASAAALSVAGAFWRVPLCRHQDLATTERCPPYWRHRFGKGRKKHSVKTTALQLLAPKGLTVKAQGNTLGFSILRLKPCRGETLPTTQNTLKLAPFGADPDSPFSFIVVSLRLGESPAFTARIHHQPATDAACLVK